VTVFDVHEIIKDPAGTRGPLRSCDVDTRYVELSEALDEYKLLQHHSRNLRINGAPKIRSMIQNHLRNWGLST
jgi:hypothetical protein